MIVTPSQTVGPYFSIGLVRAASAGDMQSLSAGNGRDIHITGSLFDGAGEPVTDGLLEIWDAGRRAFGRFAVDPQTGAFAFDTALPRALAPSEGVSYAGHLAVGIFARGLLKRLYTRIYFAGDPSHAGDPILALVPAQRRATLLANPTDEACQHFAFDIRLAGLGETVFFHC